MHNAVPLGDAPSSGCDYKKSMAAALPRSSPRAHTVPPGGIDCLGLDWSKKPAGMGTNFGVVRRQARCRKGIGCRRMGYIRIALIHILGSITVECWRWSRTRLPRTLPVSRLARANRSGHLHRLFGSRTRTFVNIAQAFQMFCTVAVIIQGNSQIMSQVNGGHICYIVIGMINVVIGISSCGLRALKHVGWLANFAVWLNIISFIIILVVAPKYGPDPTYALQTTLLKTSEPVKTFWTVPPAEYQQQTTDLFAAQFNGIDSIVYAYSGALLFVAFLSEMRHPMDFWKAVLLAQFFISVVYLFFGAFVYSNIGQYSVSTITQVVKPHSIQVASNILALLTAFLAVFLYFNIGMKVVYLHIGQELLHLPPLHTQKGYITWLGLGPLYWIIAWVVSMSVPNFAGLTGLIGGLLSLNFTYSIPAIMYCAFIIQKGALLPGEGFDPYTVVTTRVDNGFKRYARGIRKTWCYSVPAILFACGGLASSGMGSWAAIKGLIQVFGPGGTIQTAWGCAGPG